MKSLWFLSIPCSFLSGLLFLLLLQWGGWVTFQKAPLVAPVHGEQVSASAINSADIKSESQSDDAQLGIDSPVSAEASLATLPLYIQNELDFIKEEMAVAVKERARLQEQLNVMQQQATALSESTLSSSAQEALLINSDSAANNIAERIAARRGPATAEQQYSSLLAAGVDEATATRIKQQADQLQLARLELLDQSAREGWQGTEKLHDGFEQLRSQTPDLQAELGDASYDRYLYASGADNRVLISNVIGGSEAELAGLKTGDLIVQYAAKKMFSATQLQEATREGERGEVVAVDVSRNGEYLSFSMPRGPMGITLESTREDPDS